MAHGRKQVRDAVVAALTGLTTTGSRVHVHRVYPMEADLLSALNVRTGAESVDEDCVTRTVDVIVEARAQATATLYDTADLIASEVEAALAADITLGGVAVHVLPPETEPLEMADEIEKPVGLLVMSFPVVYRVEMSDPDTLLN